MYLYGTKFMYMVDYKPLVSIYSINSREVSVRVRRHWQNVTIFKTSSGIFSDIYIFLI